MAIEKERKFLLKFFPEHLFIGKRPKKLKQAYLIVHGKEQLRVRIINNKQAFLGFKIVHSPKLRTEYEFPIHIKEAKELYEKAKIKLKKERHTTFKFKNIIDIDTYPNGLQVVEIEYLKEKDFYIPNFCGKEITGVKKYSNIQLAKQFSKKNKK